MLFFYQNPGCAPAIEDGLRFIPKRVVRDPDPPAEAWGLYAEEGLNVPRFFVVILVVVLGTVAFVPYWLSKHPGDIQNAFTPPSFALLIIGTVLIAPEFVGFTRKRKQS
ncbi:hypothetical protein TWF696_004940 [Orbilia brochopaga]|uniref:Uncharacterized protein n=1 Tax=Orbilia brochopaga TaxID=3140254 RepID=A0AAV9V1I9_9PEZI